MDYENTESSYAGKIGAALRRAMVEKGIEQGDGSIARQKGTPQGGVASLLLANLYTHHDFDFGSVSTFPPIRLNGMPMTLLCIATVRKKPNSLYLL
jgi:hypothetical protein